MKPPRVRLSGISTWEPGSPLTGFSTSKWLLPDVNIWLFYICNPSVKQNLCLQSTHRVGTEAGGYLGPPWSGRKRERSLVVCQAQTQHPHGGKEKNFAYAWAR